MKRSIESNYVHPMDIESSNGNSDDSPSFQIEKYESDFANLVPPDYSRHPLVLGKGFMTDDIDMRIVTPLTLRESGLCLLTVNDNSSCYRLKSRKFPQTFRIEIELGKRTDTNFLDGKTLEKSSYSHLLSRPQRFHSLLNSIQSSHQKESFKYLKVSLQSQEAYEIAAKGPVRPENLSDGLIYKLSCVKYAPPNIIIDATTINADAEYFGNLINEIGFKLKTSAVVSSLRTLRVGYFDLSSALLRKHCTLENVIQNIFQNEAILKKYGDPHKSDLEREDGHNIRQPHFKTFSHNIRQPHF